MPFVSVTRLRLHSWRYLPGFVWYALRSRHQAQRAQGNLSVNVLAEANMTFWTCTVWRDQSDMRAYMGAGMHRKAMPHLTSWCDEASVAHWQQDSLEPPSWPEAHRRLQKEGRRSRVEHPSDGQMRFEIPPPRV